MNYGKRGIVNQAKALSSGTNRWGNKFSLFGFCFLLSAFIGLMIIGASAGIGVFIGIRDTAPEISFDDVTPKGVKSIVYDTEGSVIGELVAKDANRIPVGKDGISEDLANAFVAIEDERFYEHNGIDIQGIIRAGFKALSSGDLSQGASTITQQLVKNTVFSEWVTEKTVLQKIKRKIQEQYVAVQLEKHVSKEDILVRYLNTINLGSNQLGVEAAANKYFGKHAYELNISECAVIAAITSAPTRYNPIKNPDNNDVRRKIVLQKMLDQGFITQIEFDEAINDDVYARISSVNPDDGNETKVNSYYVDALTEQLLKDLQEKAGYSEADAKSLLYSGGLKVYSAMDPKIQDICDRVYQDENNYPEGTKYLLDFKLTVQKANGDVENYYSEKLEAYFKEQEGDKFTRLFDSKEAAEQYAQKYQDAVVEEGDEIIGDPHVEYIPQPQVSITIEDQSTGCVVAMVGGRGNKTANRTFNRATASPRQPGSTFKVVSTYAPGIDSGKITLASVFLDTAYAYNGGKLVKDWWGAPEEKWYTVRNAIARSANVVTVQAFTLITPELGYEYLKNFGFTTLIGPEGIMINGKKYTDVAQPTALGGLTKGVTNMELNAAYATIANGGVYIEPKLYTKVVDYEGNIILDNTEPNSRRVLQESTSFLLTSAMKDVVTSSIGTGKSVNFGTTEIAGKTGTTSDYNDVWFAGYTTSYTATCWTGFDNNAKLKSKAEKDLSKTMWRKVMEEVHKDKPYSAFPAPPATVTSATVCSESGKLPIPGICDGTLKSEYFAEGTVPTETCDVHYQGEICQVDGLPAAEWCPFKAPGVLTIHPAPPEEIRKGFVNGFNENSAYKTETDEEGNTVTVPNTCHHTPEFMQQEGIEGILAGERTQAEARAAEAAAAAAGQAPPEGGDPNAAPPAPPGPPGPPAITEESAAGN